MKLEKEQHVDKIWCLETQKPAVKIDEIGCFENKKKLATKTKSDEFDFLN